MATVTKANLDTLFARVQGLEEQKKALAADVKEVFDTFASQYGEENEKSFKKATRAAYKKWKEVQKDRAEFILVEASVDELTERILED
jgi:uncharacterized protein (UPF0335 family)